MGLACLFFIPEIRVGSVLVIGAVPKPFVGHIGVIQRNAICSWSRLPGVHVVVFGNEAGVAEAARDLGVEHVPDVSRNIHGTPLLPGVLAALRQRAQGGICCYANADIVLLGDWLQAISAVSTHAKRWLAVGECWNVDLRHDLSWDDDTEKALHRLVHASGKRRGKTAIDYFCFSADLLTHCPDLAVGRAYFDNWMLRAARDEGAVVCDLTEVACVLHQNHDYAHISGGFLETRFGTEAGENLRLAGGYRRLDTLFDCTHRLRHGVLIRSWRGTLRLMRPYLYARGALRTFVLSLRRQWLRHVR